ncbi:MAG: rod shape-determining protein MreC [Bacteroidota bacterium]|nr:rod shape-determining protein MreC [Bacteroidota bacterium]MDP4205272.1 rod shape-determining protein MreC [Bacteroidota bacterium]
MRNLIRFFIRHHVIFLFLILEVFSISLIFRYNNYQRVEFLNSSNVVSAKVYSIYSSISDYFSLKQVNQELAEENARLRTQLEDRIVTGRLINFHDDPDSLKPDYYYVPAKIIRNSINDQFNYITLNRGSRHGVRPEMGVCTADGVVGVIAHVSENYSTAISLLNSKLKINVKLKKTGAFGSLEWDNGDYRETVLNEIPFHIKISQGDTVVTSGYSSMFPEGIPIGKVIKVGLNKGSSFYAIKVALFADFKRLNYVDIIDFTRKDERDKLEQLEEQDKK